MVFFFGLVPQLPRFMLNRFGIILVLVGLTFPVRDLSLRLFGRVWFRAVLDHDGEQRGVRRKHVLAVLLGLVVAPPVGRFRDVVVGHDMQFEHFVMSSMAQHAHASQYSGHYGHAHGHPPVEGVVGMMLGVLGVFHVLFRPLRHGCFASS